MMGKRFDSLVFPGGKSKACTLSYDDGVVQDRRLAELLRHYGIKCTFNLGSARKRSAPEPARKSKRHRCKGWGPCPADLSGHTGWPE